METIAIGRRGLLAACLSSAVAGALLTIFVQAYLDSRIPGGWNPVVTSGAAIDYSSPALYEADIPLPHVLSLAGEARFLTGGGYRGGRTRVGYKVDVAVESLDRDRIPEHYRSERRRVIGQRAFLERPVEEVVYEVAFLLELKDQRGFRLMHLTGPVHRLESGRNHRFRELIGRAVPISIARRTERIALTMQLQRCISCDSHQG